VQAIEAVAEMLGNTPSVCRKCYVHPAVLNSYLEGSVLEMMRERVEEELDEHSLRPEEAAVLHMLQQRLASEEAAPPKPVRRRKRAASTTAHA
jgi:DNA topoisomerase-1